VDGCISTEQKVIGERGARVTYAILMKYCEVNVATEKKVWHSEHKE